MLKKKANLKYLTTSTLPLDFKESTLKKLFVLFCAFSGLIFLGCGNSTPKLTKFSDFPQKILWAWERPENLEFIDSKQFGVAFLAQTIELTGNEVIVSMRRQPLKLAPNTKLIAVTRIETNKRTERKAELSDLQRTEILRYILKTLESKNVSAIQIDFDATVSERDFYRKLLADLRQQLSKDFPLSITALASFCIDDSWNKDLPVDEIVPMIFRMGADEKTVKNYLADGNDFKNPACQTSYGIAVDEPIKTSFPTSRRIYYFNIRSWTENDVKDLIK